MSQPLHIGVPPGFEHQTFKVVSWSVAPCQVNYYSLNSYLSTQYLIAEMLYIE